MLTRRLPFECRARSCSMCSVRGPQMSHRDLNLAVVKLPPVLDDGRVVSLRDLIKDFPGFLTSGVNWQLEYPWRLNAGHPGCQILGARGHVGPPELRGACMVTPILERPGVKLKGWGKVSPPLSPLITGCSAKGTDAPAPVRHTTAPSEGQALSLIHAAYA